ncbi:hrp65 protein-like isoform X2 [Anthonomus grandis grandis]|uniref:hrp65 protein-like isoform X2 n=1 Tax=Anthonomus grandis grandis TaxID=2921223 RepID=UPI0021665E74|nr:hrp65 protein-like isoform X2 [Anthonomus grandis grandis]
MADQTQAENSPAVKPESADQTRDSNNFQRRSRGGSRFSSGPPRGGANQTQDRMSENQNQQGDGDSMQVKQENSDQNAGNHQNNRRGGRGGSRFSSGPGRGGFHNRGGPDGDKNDRNDFKGGDGERGRGRGRGRGGFRGGRDGPRGGGGGEEGMDGDTSFRPRGHVDKIAEKIMGFQGPTFELPPMDMTEKKFNGRNRLYVGNIGSDVTEEDLVEHFKVFGETSEVFLNKDKNFGFIKLDYHANAEKAKRELDGTVLKGRNLKIRFAPTSATIKVKNLCPYVSNELLFYAFSPFGEIEKAHVSVDERGKPTGEGYIHFARKFSATLAIKKCSEGCYFLTTSLQPVIVEPYEIVDDIDGFADKSINKKHPDFMREREQPPRMAHTNSFEFEYGQRWKVLYELHQQKEEALKKELALEKEKLVAQMEYAKYEHETEMLRNQLRAREMDKERQKREWEMKERMAEEERQRQEETMRTRQEEMEARMLASQEDMRRRQQENNLFMQAHNLDSLLEQQEQVFDQPNFGASGGADGEQKQFMSSYERHNRFEGRDNQSRGGSHGGNRGHWVSDRRGGGNDDFQNKRRRF